MEMKKTTHTLNPHVYKTAKNWIKIFDNLSPEVNNLFSKIYGNDSSLYEEKRQVIVKLLQEFINNYGADRQLILCRAPGRINLLGRHIEHRGGYVNVMAINREIIMAVSPRDDDLVRLRNLEKDYFPNRDFRISELIENHNSTDWISFITSNTVQRLLERTPGDWSHYVRAPLLRFLLKNRTMKLTGMDCMVSGNIPIGSGLSSSSALVVGSALATLAINDINWTTGELIDVWS